MSCATCIFWAGDDTTYQAPCTNPNTLQASTTFDHTCTMHAPRIVAEKPAQHATAPRSAYLCCPKCGAPSPINPPPGFTVFIVRCHSCGYTIP